MFTILVIENESVIATREKSSASAAVETIAVAYYHYRDKQQSVSIRMMQQNRLIIQITTDQEL